MKKGQKLSDNGYEIMLFPFEYLYMSQDEGGDFSHANTYNIDFLGWGANGRIYKCPFYAPCTLKCVAIWDNTSNNRVYESVNQVLRADGSLGYITISFAHDDNPIHNIGDIIKQGELLGHTGTTGNVTGDHTHSCCGFGKYEGYTQRTGGHYDLKNRVHYWDCCYTNDTVIQRGFGHSWRNYSFTPTPIPPLKNSFPFVLYAKRLRLKRR